MFSTPIKLFQCDGALELIKGPFAWFLMVNGISYHIPCPHTPQQNAFIERKICYITKMRLTLLLHASLLSPHELLFHTPSNGSHLRVFECSCFPFLGFTCLDKLTPKSIPCLFIGYSP